MSQARIDRLRHIRRRAVAGAVALFVAVWGLIGIQLASGNDPALKQSDTGTGATSSSSATTTTTDQGTDQLSTADQSSQDISPVTTSQS
jgi:hypothetical protein